MARPGARRDGRRRALEALAWGGRIVSFGDTGGDDATIRFGKVVLSLR